MTFIIYSIPFNPIFLYYWGQLLPKIYSSQSFLWDPPISRMDLWLTKAWANTSRVYWMLRSPCLLGTVGTTPDEPLTKDYSAGSDTGAVPVWLGNLIPLRRDICLLSLRIPPPFGPNLKRNEDAQSAKSTGSKTYALIPNWHDPIQFSLWKPSRILCVSDIWRMSSTKDLFTLLVSNSFYTFP